MASRCSGCQPWSSGSSQAGTGPVAAHRVGTGELLRAGVHMRVLGLRTQLQLGGFPPVLGCRQATHHRGMDIYSSDPRTTRTRRWPACAALASLGFVVLMLGVVGVATAIEQAVHPPTCFGIGFGCTPDALSTVALLGMFVGAPVVAVAWILTVIGWMLTGRRSDRMNRLATCGRHGCSVASSRSLWCSPRSPPGEHDSGAGRRLPNGGAARRDMPADERTRHVLPTGEPGVTAGPQPLQRLADPGPWLRLDSDTARHRPSRPAPRGRPGACSAPGGRSGREAVNSRAGYGGLKVQPST
jgi:hypothetical protein